MNYRNLTKFWELSILSPEGILKSIKGIENWSSLIGISSPSELYHVHSLQLLTMTAPIMFGFTTTGGPIVLYKSGYCPLSNFNPRKPFTVRGVNYTCGEAYYQACKAHHFNDDDAWKRIQASRSPKEMKQIGQEIRGYNEKEWSKVALEVMRRGVKEKMLQNDEARKLLMSTEGAIIGEVTHFDRYWGVGLDIEDQAVYNLNNWVGSNHMGEILMSVRDEIKG